MGSGQAYDGGRSITVDAPDALNDGNDTTGLRGLPVFVRAGAVIPSAPVVSYEGQRKLDTLNIDIYPGSATSELYEDAGDGYAYQRGEYRRTIFTTAGSTDAQGAGSRLSVTFAQTGSYAGAGSFRVTVHDVRPAARASVDGRVVRTNYNAVRRELSFVVPGRVRQIQIE
jgi:alpha-glucosidase (family GH31 glycosyl hydrolase)